uniref:Uncharacterized protein n=1 Tax=Sphaerodactylus townsendi TaxID=933632 RepID=A0ACB8GBN6_9SAUR
MLRLNLCYCSKCNLDLSQFPYIITARDDSQMGQKEIVDVADSSNGKSVSWSEPGGSQVPKGQHMWHRLSVHVKSKELGCNQTAVIKPLTKSYPAQGKNLTFSDISSKTLYNVVEEEEREPVHFSQLSSPPTTVHRRVTMTPPLQGSADEAHLFLPEQNPKSLLPPQRSIMEQLQGVVNKFASGIPDFNSVIPVPGTANGVRPIYHPPLVQQQVLPVPMGTFSKELVSPPAEEEGEEEEEENEKFKLIPEYVYERPGNLEEEEEEQATSKLTLEDSPALTPPSPFRDSVASGSSVPSSPVSESVLCTPPSATYASVVLRDYKQSSSTL